MPEPLPAAPPTPARRLRWAGQTFVLLLLLWLALDGTGALAVGALFALLGALLGGWLVPGEPHPWRPLRLAAFLLYFIRTSILGGVDVARRALDPRLPIAPGYLQHRCRLPAGLPRTAFVGVVSLLPGTLSVELLDDGDLRVHALSTDGVDAALRELETHLFRLFSLEHVAAAPVPR
jgi:multicomponent Na+:H+ antiporter subunit E